MSATVVVVSFGEDKNKVTVLSETLRGSCSICEAFALYLFIYLFFNENGMA